MQRSILITLAAASFLLSADCTDNGVRSISARMALSDFPLAIGSQWIYARFDSLAMRTETVTVTITLESVTNEGDTVSVWVYDSGSDVDTQYVRVFGDTVTFAKSLESILWERVRFVFPITVNKAWTGPGLVDSTRVVRHGPVEVPAGTFQEGFLLERRAWSFNQYDDARYWIAPDVGLVHEYNHSFGMSYNEAATWELLSYSIAP